MEKGIEVWIRGEARRQSESESATERERRSLVTHTHSSEGRRTTQICEEDEPEASLFQIRDNNAQKNIGVNFDKLHLEDESSCKKKVPIKTLSEKDLRGIVFDDNKVKDLFESWISEYGKSFDDYEKQWRFKSFRYNVRHMIVFAADYLKRLLRTPADLTEWLWSIDYNCPDTVLGMDHIGTESRPGKFLLEDLEEGEEMEMVSDEENPSHMKGFDDDDMSDSDSS